ncbi:MAG: ACT domain-containing protein [Oscillospiraceae bacterium]|jgi:hypothetical protein|nr:ACT domain-containing protein [Oscillospiraceae bacterium]
MIRQLSIFVENRPGRMADITEALCERGIDIRALSLADTSDFGLLRLIVTDPDAAQKALGESGVMVKISEVIAIGVTDSPGEFSRAIRLLADAKVNLEYLYAFLSRRENEAVIILRVDNPEAAARTFEAHGVRILGEKEVYSL